MRVGNKWEFTPFAAVLDPKVLVTKVLGSLNKGINWLYPVSDVKSLIGFTAYFGN